MDDKQYCSVEEEHESLFEQEPKYDTTIPVCSCLRDDESSEKVEISERKLHILSTVARTEHYLRDRRVPELIRFLLTKVIAEASDNPIAYLEKLLNDCMLFRAGHGLAPVIYEDKHLEAVVRSFDPGQRGWLSAGQVRRAYITLGLTPPEIIEERVSTQTFFEDLKECQENELLHLLKAGIEKESYPSNDLPWL